jgi:hypothetical protein
VSAIQESAEHLDLAAPVLFTDEAAFNAAVAGAGLATRQDGFEGLAKGYRGPLDREGFTVRGDVSEPDVKSSMIRMDRVGYEDVTATPVPEPSTMLLLGAGLAGVARLRKSRR